MYQIVRISFLSFGLLLMIINSMSTPIISTQELPLLIIEIYDSNDWNESINNIVFEGRTYDIIVTSENETVVFGVNISLLNDRYTTSETEPYVTIHAPRFNDSESFIITAAKQNYLTNTIAITVMKGELSVITNQEIIEEKKEFQITVQDQDNTPIEGAYVYVNSNVNPVITDQQGIVYIHAPEIEIGTNVTINAIKSGYVSGSTNIRIENIGELIFTFPETQFLQILPIFIAIIVVIFSVIYVLWRQKRTSEIPNKTIRIESTDVPHALPKGKYDASISPPLSRVEEIRIPVQTKIKETTILPSEKKLDQITNNEKKEQYEWFKGQDHLRYKLDELTGKIDQKTDGRWFEGENNSKNKVDKTLQKNIKKKKNDEEDIR